MTLQVAEPQIRHWTLAEYYKLAEEGWFQGQRVQLVDGEIIQMPPQGHPHFKSLSLVGRWLHENFGPDYWVRLQAPLNASPDTDPEPDAAVVPGPIEEYQDHPQSALLVIEVAESSLRLDRRKAAIYAAAGVQEYWIINLEGRCVEIYRDPVRAAGARLGFSYSLPTIAKEHETMSPLAPQGASVKVADLLP